MYRAPAVLERRVTKVNLNWNKTAFKSCTPILPPSAVQFLLSRVKLCHSLTLLGGVKFFCADTTQSVVHQLTTNFNSAVGIHYLCRCWRWPGRRPSRRWSHRCWWRWRGRCQSPVRSLSAAVRPAAAPRCPPQTAVDMQHKLLDSLCQADPAKGNINC